MTRRVNSRTSRVRVVAAERRAEALELRGAGHTFAMIADALGVTRQRASQIVNAALEDLATRERDAVQSLRIVEWQRLEVLEDAFLPSALAGDVGAGRLLIRIAERRARLAGLDLTARGPLVQVAAVGHMTTTLGREPRDRNQYEFARRLWRAESVAEREEIIDESPERLTPEQRTAVLEVTFPTV